MISEKLIFFSDPKFIEAQNSPGNRNKISTTFKHKLVTAKDNTSPEKDELGMKIIFG